jgi:hypothetical protein
MEEEDVELQSYNFDGILGLGFASQVLGQQNISDYPFVPMYSVYRPTTVFKNIVKQELLPQNIFSFYYAR